MNRNIVLICFKYPPKYSGYGKQLKSVVTEMKKYHPDLKLILLTAYECSKIEEDEFLKVIPLGCENIKKESIVFYIFCLRTFFWLVINRSYYSVIHCIKAGPEAVVANIVSKIFHKPLIVKVVQDELSNKELESVKGLKMLLRKARHIMLRNVDYFVAISDEIEENLKRIISESSRILRIPNGVDTKKFYPISFKEKIRFRNMLKLPEHDIIILFVGAISKRKGILDLLETMKIIETDYKVTLVICGPILEELDIGKIIDEINNKKKNIKIIYRGEINNVDEYMKAADIFVLPSYSEGLPNVLLEAAATGLTLVATDIGGNRDIIKDSENGFLIKTGDLQSLKKHIEDLVENNDKRLSMSLKSLEIIKNRYSLEQVATEYLKLYTSLLN